MKRMLLIAGLGLCLLLGARTVMAGTLVDVRAVLGGEVSWTEQAGARVAEGSALVCIKTLTGEAVAARSTVTGTVREVKVTPGTKIAPGVVVARVVKD